MIKINTPKGLTQLWEIILEVLLHSHGVCYGE